MGTLAWWLVAIAGGIGCVFLLWRWGSQRRSIPCPVWLRWLVELDNPFTKTSRAAVIVQHLDVRRGMCVLDVGCGPGRVTVPLAQAVGPAGRVVAIDLQDGMLERAREQVGRAKLENVWFVCADVGDAVVDTEAFDRAVLVSVLGEIPRREQALKKIFNALKPGGILSVTEVIFDPHYQSRKTITRLAVAVGYQIGAAYGNRFAFTLNLQKPSLV